MRLDRLWLTDFRNHRELDLSLAPGLTAVLGANGQGKTNLLEAVGYLATLSSFRGAPTEALVADGADRAIVRGEGVRDHRSLLLETEIAPGGRSRAQLNRQPLRRARDLLGALRVSVFTPEDLALVKGPPAGRRAFLDDVMVALSPRDDALGTEVDKILRQRNALLKQAGGRLDASAEATLDVWDAKLAEAGEALAAARETVVERLGPRLADAVARLAGEEVPVALAYERSWDAGLREALARGRDDDVRRGVSLRGPHRDELAVTLASMAARTHASQGEQRTLALGLRLAAHHLVTEATGSPPVLLLDDVFSELDGDRANALLAELPDGQALLTSASGLPPKAKPDHTVHLEDGRIRA